MMTVTKLTAETAQTAAAEDPRSGMVVVHAEVGRGCFLHLSMGSLGLLIFHGKARVLIPTKALTDLAIGLEPDLANGGEKTGQ